MANGNSQKHKPISARIPIQLWKQLKITAAMRGLKITDVLIRAIEREVKLQK